MLLSLSHLLYATVKIKHLKAAFVGKLCYLWESKSVMFRKWECTFQSWVGTFVTKLFLLLIKREVREICVHVGLSEYLWGLTIFFFCPHDPCCGDSALGKILRVQR